MPTFNTKFERPMPDDEINEKLVWLENRLPMTRIQIIKRAIERYYNYHLSRCMPTAGTIKNTLLQDQKHECYYCKKYLTWADATIDHKIPLARGGSRDDPSNLCAACIDCNRKKDAMTEAEFRLLTETQKHE